MFGPWLFILSMMMISFVTWEIPPAWVFRVILLILIFQGFLMYWEYNKKKGTKHDDCQN